MDSRRVPSGTGPDADRADRPVRPEPNARVREGFLKQRMTVLPRAVVEHSSDLPVVRDLFVTDIGHYPTAHGHYVDRPSGCDESILIYCTGGRGWCEMAGREWRAGEGWALIIPPDTPHTYGAHVGEPWTIWWVHFGGTLASQYLQALGTTPRQPLLYAPATLRMSDAFEETYGQLRNGYPDAALFGLSTGVAHVLGLLVTHQRAPDSRGRGGEDKIRRTVRYMRDHLDRPLALQDLAGLVDLSVPYYSALFRKVMGTPPGQFLTHLKMRRACELLDTTDALVADVGRQVGFTDPFHFSRAFKRVVGQAPSHYRRTVKG